jgi:Ca-activated chloride channel family protein
VSAARIRTRAALALQVAALAAVVLSLVGVSWLDARTKPRWLLLVDRSESVPRPAADQAVAAVASAIRATGGTDPQRLEFAGKPNAPSLPGAIADAGLEPSSTDIEAALDAALMAHADEAFDGIVVVSDGQENIGDAARALRAVREARVPLQWIAVSRAPPSSRVVQVLAPTRARVGQRIQVSVQLAGALDGPLRLEASARSPSGETQSASTEVVGQGRATIALDASRSGVMIVDVLLRDPATGAAIDALTDAAVIDIAPAAAILYVQGSTGSFAQSLARGGWALDVVPAARLDAHAEGLDSYQAVVLDDVAVTDAGPRFWSALVAAVRDRGLGLLVLGGERSFARGGYRGSALESVLPVLSEPAALDQPMSVVFAVDKSGSMGQGSGGVDRFQLAQKAVLETARGLGERDAFALLVFDVAPRLLIPLGPAADGVAVLARDWRASPNGGTRIGPALEAAIAELERSGPGRRMLVIATDGYTDDAPIAELRAHLARARIETIALAIGPDADVAALQRLFGAAEGQVLRVGEAAELPLVMRTGLERRRARVERGTIAVEQRLALPLQPGMVKDWPAIAGHAVTRSQAGAVVAVQSRQGDPLIALQRSGRGRVVAITCGFGPWSPAWLSWHEWPRLAGGLADWVSGTSQAGGVALTVSDLPKGLRIDADLPFTTDRSDGDEASIVVSTPTTRNQSLVTDRVAPGRLQAMLPDAGAGLYTFLVMTPFGTQRQLHLRRHRAETATWGTNPALVAWRAEGLIEDWDPRRVATLRDAQRGARPLDRSLMALGLALFLCGVLVDRARIDGRGVMDIVRRRARRR